MPFQPIWLWLTHLHKFVFISKFAQLLIFQYIHFSTFPQLVYILLWAMGFLLLFCFLVLVLSISWQCQNKPSRTIPHSDNFLVYTPLPTPAVSLLFLFSSTTATFLPWLRIPGRGCTAISSIPGLRKATWPYCAVVVQHHGQCLMPQTHILLVRYENRFFCFYRSSSLS